MNIGKQIDSLLKRYSSVYINGLGVFQKVNTSATFDSKRNVFLPPISYIEFDHFGTEGYSFLTYLQQLEHLNQDEAEQRLKDIVSNIKEHIQQDGEFELEYLGTLVSYGNSFVFKPLDLTGFLHTPIKDDYYQPIVATPTSNKEIVEEPPFLSESTKLDNEDEEIEAEPEATLLENNIEQQESPKLETEKVYQVEPELLVKKKEGNSYIYGLVAAIAVLVLGGIYYYATLKPERTLVEKLVTVESIPLDTTFNDVDTAFVEGLSSEDEVITQDTAILNPSMVPAEPVKVEDKYAIVIGTHKVLEMALEEAKSYNKKGHHTVRVMEPNMSKNLKRVIWDTYPTREKRDSALRVVRKLYKADAWGTEI